MTPRLVDSRPAPPACRAISCSQSLSYIQQSKFLHFTLSLRLFLAYNGSFNRSCYSCVSALAVSRTLRFYGQGVAGAKREQLAPSYASALIAKRAGPTLPAGWTYQGCYVDGVSGRILGNQQPDSSTLTIESCIATCNGLGYSVAGVEYSSQCFCDNYLINGGTKAAADTECNTACAGNGAEQCGGGNRMSIYAKGSLVTRQAPGPQKTGLPGSWTYQGCIT